LRPAAVADTPRLNCNEMAGDRLSVFEQQLLLAFARLVSNSSNFLLKDNYGANSNYYLMTEICTF